LHGTLFDLDEFRIRQEILHDPHPGRARAPATPAASWQ
jgi:hypothetical protein